MAGFHNQKENNSGMRVLRSEIGSKTFRRVYLLFGEESYLVGQYRNDLVRALVPEGDTMNLNIHRSLPEFGQLQDEILSVPFFAPFRVVVIEDSGLFQSRNKKQQSPEEGESGSDDEARSETDEDEGEDSGEDMAAMLAAFLPNIPDSTVLIFTERPNRKKPGDSKGKVSVDKRGKLYKAVAKYGLAVEFEALTEKDISAWVLRQFKNDKVNITSGAFNLFLEKVGTDMNHVKTETEKLISFAGEGGEIHREDVEAITCEILEGKVFRMLELMTAHDRKGALALYDDLMQLREPVPMILVLAVRHLRELVLLKNCVDRGMGNRLIATELKWPDWKVRNAMNQVRRLDSKNLTKAFRESVRLLELSRTGGLDAQIALELMIVKCSA